MSHPPPYGAQVKKCTRCGVLKDEGEFYAARGTRDGLRGDCKACHILRGQRWYAANRQKAIDYAKAWNAAHPERVKAIRKAATLRRRALDREQHLRRTFGLSSKKYEQLLQAQGGGCAVCGREPISGRALHVDHDHETGNVRGLLCFRCNAGLGQFREQPERLAAGVVYLVGGWSSSVLDSAERSSLVGLFTELLAACGRVDNEPPEFREPAGVGLTAEATDAHS